MREDPYAHCPRMPEEGEIDPRRLFLPASEGALPFPPEKLDEPVELEIGPGRGWFTVERLEHDPETRVIGAEIRRKWATIIDERLQKRDLAHRGRCFAEDIKLVLPRFRTASVKIAYLHFPDPWWKKRHEKRIVLGDPLMEELSRVLIPGGELLIQTDVFERADQYEKTVASCSAFEPWEDQPRVEDHPHVARSPRERKAIEYELPVVRLRYRNRGPSETLG